MPEWKIDFSSLLPEVQESTNDKIEDLVDVIFETVLGKVKEILWEEYIIELRNISNDRKKWIKDYLINWMIQWGNRENDRPWGIQKVTEEARKRILTALVREIIPAFSAKTSTQTPDEYIEDIIQPYLSRFDLPNNLLPYISPSAYWARKRQNKKTKS